MDPEDVDGERLLTPVEAARMFGVTVRTLARWAREGKLASVRTPGGQRRYYAQEVKAILTMRSLGRSQFRRGVL